MPSYQKTFRVDRIWSTGQKSYQILSRLHCQNTWVAARRTGTVDGGSQVALHDAGQLTLAPHLRSRRTAEVPAEEIVLQFPLCFPL